MNVGARPPAPRVVPLGGDFIAVHESGAGDPVLLVHSGGFSARQWRTLAEMLASTHRVMAPDLLGYGASSPWPVGKPFHLRQDLAALEVLLDTSAVPTHLVGHSYGGLLALKLALSRPALVRSLSLFEPVAFGILDEAADQEARASLSLMSEPYRVDASGADDEWLAKFVDWWNGPGAFSGLQEEAKASLRAVGWKVSQEVASIADDATDRTTYGSIQTPTLLLGGDRSPRTERRVLEKLTAALPNASLELLSGVGHMGPITHGSIVNAAIAAHIRNHTKTPASH